MTQCPLCHRCQHRHLITLPCWNGRRVSELRTLVLSTYGDVCVHCGELGARSVEHLTPRSLGGTDSLSNLRPAHLRCNISRGTDPMAGPVTDVSSDRW